MRGWLAGLALGLTLCHGLGTAPPPAAAHPSLPVHLPPTELGADVLLEPLKADEVEGFLGPARRPARFSPSDVHAALARASARTRCIVRVEIAGVGWNPYAIGSQGELGPGQLHPRGLLPQFLAETGGDPFNPYTVLPWIDRMLQRGYAPHWAGVRRGVC